MRDPHVDIHGKVDSKFTVFRLTAITFNNHDFNNRLFYYNDSLKSMVHFNHPSLQYSNIFYKKILFIQKRWCKTVATYQTWLWRSKTTRIPCLQLNPIFYIPIVGVLRIYNCFTIDYSIFNYSLQINSKLAFGLSRINHSIVILFATASMMNFLIRECVLPDNFHFRICIVQGKETLLMKQQK